HLLAAARSLHGNQRAVRRRAAPVRVADYGLRRGGGVAVRRLDRDVLPGWADSSLRAEIARQVKYRVAADQNVAARAGSRAGRLTEVDLEKALDGTGRGID